MKRATSIIFALLLLFCLVACHSDDRTLYQNDAEDAVEYENNDLYADDDLESVTYVLNTSSKKIHKSTCGTGDLIAPENRQTFRGNIEKLFKQGYTKCGNCFR